MSEQIQFVLNHLTSNDQEPCTSIYPSTSLAKFNSLGYSIYATVYINYKLLWLVVDSHMVRVVLYKKLLVVA